MQVVPEKKKKKMKCELCNLLQCVILWCHSVHNLTAEKDEERKKKELDATNTVLERQNVGESRRER